MRMEFITWFFSITTLTIICSITIPVHSKCLEDQKSFMLQLKNSLQFDSDFSVKLVSWAQSNDCCQWNGVTCDHFGRVIGLDLNTESISGGLNDSSSLFGLKFLEKLNLAYNSFNSTRIPSSFGVLTNLKYLNLSPAEFVRQIPMEFSRLTRLVKLDLSNHDVYNSYGIRIDNPNLFTLFGNLGGLAELYLDGVNISANGYEWGQAISSSLPNLRVLSLSDCLLSGPIDSFLQNLQCLSEINLARNNLSSPVPDFFVNFPEFDSFDSQEDELAWNVSRKHISVGTNIGDSGFVRQYTTQWFFTQLPREWIPSEFVTFLHQFFWEFTGISWRLDGIKKDGDSRL